MELTQLRYFLQVYHLKNICNASARLNVTQQAVSKQIRKLEEISKKIFEFVAENPKKAPQIRKFMNYYLPTTLKLLEAYERFRSQDVKGQNLTMAMKHIENVLSTIIAAFEKLLDNLFQDEAFDISAEITVLENMLTQEGLTEEGFALNSTLSQERTAKHD